MVISVQRVACVGCGSEMVGRKRKYCTQPCRWKATRPVYRRGCERCSKSFETLHPEQRMCGGSCAQFTRNDSVNPNVLCRQCGVSFRPKVSKHNTFCTRACAFANHAAPRRERYTQRRDRQLRNADRLYHEVRRARLLGAAVGRVLRSDVFSRDGWRCRGCGVAVATAGWPRPDYATIDHIIPLSKGGEHSMGNVQLLCYHCNVKKGAKVPVA